MNEAHELEVLPANLRRIAYFMDESIRLPGGFRIGWDAIIGLIPGVGDAIGTLVSSYLVLSAARLGVGKAVLLRMIGNVGLELLVGTIPIVGDIFDGLFKANTRNLSLLGRHAASPRANRRYSMLWLVLVGAGFVALGVTLLVAAVQVGLWLWDSITQLLAAEARDGSVA